MGAEQRSQRNSSVIFEQIRELFSILLVAKMGLVNCGVLVCLVVVVVFVRPSCSYDLTLDTMGDVRSWKFSGTFLYSPQVEDIEGFFPLLTQKEYRLTAAKKKPQEMIPGIWFTKHVSGGKNSFRITYRLTHALFRQCWIKFLGESSVALVVKGGSSEKYIGTFWSDGKTWCDAVMDVGLESSIQIEVQTPEANDYILIDKIVMGIMSNVSILYPETHHPCRRAGPRSSTGEETTTPSSGGMERTGEGGGGGQMDGGGGGSSVHPSSVVPTQEATLEDLETFLEHEEETSDSGRSGRHIVPSYGSSTLRAASESTDERASSSQRGRRRAQPTMIDGKTNKNMNLGHDPLSCEPCLTTTTTTTNTTTTNTAVDSTQSNVDCNCTCQCKRPDNQ